MTKTLLEMAAEIVTAQATHTRMTLDELSGSLQKVFESLKAIKAKEEGLPVPEEGSEGLREEFRTNPVASIQRDKVVCLECLQEFKQLSQGHLKGHGLTLKEYKKKWGFKSRQPLSARALTTRRKKLAKDRGLAEKLAQFRRRGRRETEARAT